VIEYQFILTLFVRLKYLQTPDAEAHFPMPKTRNVLVLAFLWLIAIGIGVHTLMAYKGTSGESGEQLQKWPQNSPIGLPSDKPLLVMFAHPRCPCTKASIGELEMLVAQAKDEFKAIVVFHEPSGLLPSSDSASVKQARANQNIRVLIDETGLLAKQFGAETSGHTVVYNPAGKLLFAGGITGSRGHLGENAGSTAALSSIRDSNGALSARITKVFGCEIFN